MLAVLITLTPGLRNEFIDCQNTKVWIEALPIMDVKTRWNSTPKLLQRAYRLREFTCKWLKDPKFSDYWPLLTTQVQWTIITHITEVLRPSRYWTMSMSKRHTVTLHAVITLHNDMFKILDGIMRALAKNRTQWKGELYFAVKFAWQQLYKYYAEVTPTTSVLLISASILDCFRKLRPFRKWVKGMDIKPEGKTSYTTQYWEALLTYVENENCAKRGWLLIIKPERILCNNLFPSAMTSGFGQSSFDPYDLSSDDEEYEMPNNMAETAPRCSNRAACLMIAARLHWDSPPESPQILGQLIRIWMIPTPTQWRWAVHFGYRISPTGGVNTRQLSECTLITPMWHPTYSLSYHIVSEWRPVFPLSETFSAGGSEKPHERPLTKKS